MGFNIGGFFNSLTQPLGIKLFSGGPYSDAGKGDEMQGNVQQYLAQLAPIIAQIAQNAGVRNPMAGPTGPGQDQGYNPYSLSPLQQSEVNQQASIDTQAYDNIISKVRANLAARGMSDSSTMAAAEAYLRKQLASQISSTQVQAGENAFQNRNQALQQISGLLGQGFGAKQQVTDVQRQQAISSSQGAMQQLGSLLALGLYAGGVSPFGQQKPGESVPRTGGVAGPVQTPGFGGFQPSYAPMSLSGGGAYPSLGNFGSIYGR